MNRILSWLKTPLGALGTGVAVILVVVLSAYGLTRLASRGEVMGKIEVAPRAIATIAARAVGQSYGVVGMAPHTLREGMAQVLRQADAHRGVEVHISDSAIAIDLYVILEYGTRISEVAHNIQENVRYAVEQALGMPIGQINVRVQGLRMNDRM